MIIPAVADPRVELVMLVPKRTTARCRVARTQLEVTLHAPGMADIVPGEIVDVRVQKEWRSAGQSHVSGAVEGRYLDASALGLLPLRLNGESTWHPEEHYWGGDDEPLEEWAKPIVAHGARPSYEMEHVIPGEDPEDWDSDPIIESNELHAIGRVGAARKLLLETAGADLRCLDAHAHLGNLAFETDPAKALRHYEVGVRIGELSLGEAFDGVLEWGRIDNRPFLRCMHGFALCLWRLMRTEEAAAIFERMLWLNPSDNQGIRFMLAPLRAGEPWEEEDNDSY